MLGDDREPADGDGPGRMVSARCCDEHHTLIKTLGQRICTVHEPKCSACPAGKGDCSDGADVASSCGDEENEAHYQNTNLSLPGFLMKAKIGSFEHFTSLSVRSQWQLFQSG